MKNITTPTVTLIVKKIIHHKKESLLLTFTYNQIIIDRIRSMHIFKWSQSRRGWYCDYSKENIEKINKHIKPFVILTINKESFNPEHLKYYKNRNLTEANKAMISSFEKYLIGKRYSESTVKTYISFA